MDIADAGFINAISNNKAFRLKLSEPVIVNVVEYDLVTNPGQTYAGSLTHGTGTDNGNLH
jgi:hypothetical protein